MHDPLQVTRQSESVYSYMMRDYFHRYLAGDIALREGRTVTRRQFIIAKSGIQNPNAIAAGVVTAAQRFSDAVALLRYNPKIDMTLLSEINALLKEQPAHLPVVRSNSLQLKSACGLYQHDCPAPILSLSITQQALSEFETSEATIEQLMTLMATIINAHPFADGNGRTTRAIFEAVCSTKQYPHLSPYIFVLANNNMDALLGFYRSLCNDKFKVQGQQFFDDFLAWNTQFQQQHSTLLNKAAAKISSKMLFVQTGDWYQPLLTCFWQNPIISAKIMSAKIFAITGAKLGLDCLLSRQVISLQSVHNEPCFVADDILHAHEAIEAVVFATSNH